MGLESLDKITSLVYNISMTTKNAFIFSWDNLGIESIIPISQYEFHEQENTMRLLRDQKRINNPLNGVVRSLLLRARFNPQRHYEIYAIDCTEEMDEEFWREQWEEYPQATAELIRERGHKLYSDRAETHKIKIT
jgi:hypothetical protein